MIRLATVFSGIGAIEHALDRMDIDHTIIFACDNGDVDILSPRINSNVDEIETEIYALAQLIEELNGTFDDIYKNQLFNMFDELRKEYKKTYEQLVNIQMSFLNIDDILLKIINMKNLKQNKKKEYQKLKLNLLNGSAQQVLLVRLKLILKITNDFKKDNSLDALGTNDDLVSFDGIEWNFISQDLKNLYDSFEKIGGKKIIRSIQDVSQRICQLHEKINYLKIQEHLSTFGNDWGKRKKYVDELYKGLEKRNKVKISYMANYQISEEDYHWNAAFLDGSQRFSRTHSASMYPTRV
jgi:DNA (cytosine-5)-methyltransferase 1